MADYQLTQQEAAQLRLAGWHAAERGEADEPMNPQPWRDGWHLRRFGVLPTKGPSASGPVATLRRLILASVNSTAPSLTTSAITTSARA